MVVVVVEEIVVVVVVVVVELVLLELVEELISRITLLDPSAINRFP